MKIKLIKDGQENYIKFSEGKLWYSGNNKDWFECNDEFDVTLWLRYDSIHRFVCPDKNGNDVFAGDSVKSGKRVLTIVWDKCDMQWKVKSRGSPAAEYYLPDTPLCQWAISERFELIEGENQ